MRSAAVGLAVVLAVGAQAQVVTYQITGTFTSLRGEPFGMTEDPTPFSGTVTFDRSLNTNTTVVLTGGELFGLTAQNDFYGISASTVVGVNLTTGNHTWTLADLASDMDLWASSDLSTTPQYLKLSFRSEGTEGEHYFSIGSVTADDSAVWMERNLIIDDADTPGRAAGSFSVGVAAVPEPSTYAAITGAMALLGAAVWRRRSRRTEDAGGRRGRRSQCLQGPRA